jgi:hypothetical protein
MKEDELLKIFLGNYDKKIVGLVLKLRDIVAFYLPDIIEQVDLPARMIAYTYGKKYSDMICTIIPSKNGIKLGFNRGVELPDAEKILEGTGKISRFVRIESEVQIQSSAIKALLLNALAAYRKRTI